MLRPAPIRFYGGPSDKPGLDWAWVDEQLRAAGTYWVVARTSGHPHPRPVWGVWQDERLCLSIGTPATRRALEHDPLVTVHLDSGTDVVIVEGRSGGLTSEPDVIAAYDDKYDWSYDVGSYGPLTVVEPTAILAWRTSGPAGRDSFQETGRWQPAP